MWWNISGHPSEELNMPSILQCCLVISPSPSFFHIPPFPSPLFLVPCSISISQASTPLFSFSFCSLAIDAALQPGFTSKPPLPTSRWRSADPQVTFFSPYMFHSPPTPTPSCPGSPGASKTSGPELGQRQTPCQAPLRLSPIQPPVSSILTTSNPLHPSPQISPPQPLPKSHPPTDKNPHMYLPK